MRFSLTSSKPLTENKNGIVNDNYLGKNSNHENNLFLRRSPKQSCCRKHSRILKAFGILLTIVLVTALILGGVHLFLVNNQHGSQSVQMQPANQSIATLPDNEVMKKLELEDVESGSDPEDDTLVTELIEKHGVEVGSGDGQEKTTQLPTEDPETPSALTKERSLETPATQDVPETEKDEIELTTTLPTKKEEYVIELTTKEPEKREEDNDSGAANSPAPEVDPNGDDEMKAPTIPELPTPPKVIDASSLFVSWYHGLVLASQHPHTLNVVLILHLCSWVM